MPTDRFAEVLSASPKNFREELFRQAGVRVKSDAFSVAATSKNKLRAEKLHQTMGSVELKSEVFDEIIRNYLYTRRALLSDALDELKVKHENGLTDEDLDFIAKLEPARGAALRSHLASRHDKHDVDLYMAFMNVPET